MTEPGRPLRLKDDDDQRVLTRAWRGQRAISGLESVCASGGPRLVLDARPLERADAFTGAAVVEGIDRHLRRDRGHSVILREPLDPKALAMLHDLVGPLPRRARWAGESDTPLRDRDVLLPATRAADEQTVRLLGDWLQTVVAGPLRLPLSAARLLAMGAAHFGDNALRHGSVGGGGAVLCACRDQQGNDLQLVAVSDTAPDAASVDGTEYLAGILARSTDQLGGLFSIAELAGRRGLDATVRVAAGRGRLYWRGGKPHVDVMTQAVPAYVASLEIHLAG
jgi:hypothetical protein